MKNTIAGNKGLKNNNTVGSAGRQPSTKKEQPSKEKAVKGNKYKMDFIKKDNYDTMAL